MGLAMAAAAAAISVPCSSFGTSGVERAVQCRPSGSITIPSKCLLRRTSLESARRCESKRGAKTSRSQLTVVASSAQPRVYQVTEQLVDEVRNRLEKEQGDLRVGKNGRDDPALISWFLKDRKLDVEATVAKLTRALQWRKEFGVDQITEDFIAAAAAKGEAYLHTHKDKKGRPTIVVVAKKHFPAENSKFETEKLCVALIERGVDQLPEGEDKLLGIFDLRGFTSKNADWKFVRFLVDVFYEYYPKRLGEVLFIDAPFIFSAGWNTFKPLLGSYAQLVRFCSVSEIGEYFTPDTMPEDLKS